MPSIDPAFATLRPCFPELDDDEFEATVVLPITEQLFTRTIEWLFASLPRDLGDQIVDALEVNGR